MKFLVSVRWCALAMIAAAACGKVEDPAVDPVDATVDAPPDAVPPGDAGLGSEAAPARDCAELLTAGIGSGVYWVRHPDGVSPAFRVYCEQELGMGGWAMVFNSVRREDGSTTAFWKIPYAQRTGTKGTAAPDQNYYQGTLYPLGRQYMDVIVDLKGTVKIAAVVDTTGIDPVTMKFQGVSERDGSHAGIVGTHFKGGWSSFDKDFDQTLPRPEDNCAVLYESVTQHYGNCWAYNLGSDADEPKRDGGIGPHVNNDTLTELGLTLQEPAAAAGRYSRVRRIARFTRW
jgi:hypothetical protein